MLVAQVIVAQLRNVPQDVPREIAVQTVIPDLFGI